MSPNKEIIARYRDCFSRGDRPGITSFLSEDVEWVEWADGFPESGVPRRGIAAFVGNISEPPGGWPLQVDTRRMTEEHDVVVVEGTVRVPLKGGKFFSVQTCNIFELRGGKIARLTSWTAEAKQPE